MPTRFPNALNSQAKTYPQYRRPAIDEFVRRVLQGGVYYYGWTDAFLYSALLKHPIRGKDVLIMGSNVPWYESICIAYGARHCTTLEYNSLRYEHPGIRTFTVKEWSEGRARGLACALPDLPFSCRFDAVFSISSFEHDGLGRYGDPLNPDGDIAAMASIHSYLHPDGVFYLSVPVGDDVVQWNEGRVYGATRLPLLLKGWAVQDSFGHGVRDVAERRHARITPFEVHQPVFVLRAEGKLTA